MKNRNIKIFSFVLCLVAMLFALGLNRTSAETPGVTVSGKLVDTIKNIKVTNNEGGNLDWELGQWATFRINADFDLAGKNVKKGDTTDLTVPDALIITSQSFEIRDVNTNEVIAHATVDKDNKKLSLTYTDYVEKHSDTQGSFFFYARIDFKKHPQQGEVPVEITVNGETKIGGKVTFKGVGDGNPTPLSKTSWVNDNDHKTVTYTISVNKSKQNIKEVTIEDHLRFTNASYVKDSIKVIKGKFSFEAGEWVFSNRVDVTDQHPVTISEDGQSFVVNLGDISENDQYRIDYDVRLNYEPVDGELLKNDATLKGKQFETKDVTNTAAVQVAGGSGVGYVFTIHVHKVNDESQPLAGAKFKIVRQANNQVIGEYVTDENGDITVNALLKDKYILTETEAPAGYTIKEADTVVNAEDFGRIIRLRRRSSIQKNRQRLRQPLQLLLRQQPLQRLKSRQQLLRRLKSQQRLRQQLRNLHLLPLQQLQSQQQLQQQLKNLQQRLRRLKSQQLQQRRQKVQNLRRLRQQLQRRLQPRLKNQCRLQRPLRQPLQRGQQRVRPNLVTQMILAPQLQTEVARHSCQKQVKQSLLVSS